MESIAHFSAGIRFSIFHLLELFRDQICLICLFSFIHFEQEIDDQLAPTCKKSSKMISITQQLNVLLSAAFILTFYPSCSVRGAWVNLRNFTHDRKLIERIYSSSIEHVLYIGHSMIRTHQECFVLLSI